METKWVLILILISIYILIGFQLIYFPVFYAPVFYAPVFHLPIFGLANTTSDIVSSSILQYVALIVLQKVLPAYLICIAFYYLIKNFDRARLIFSRTKFTLVQMLIGRHNTFQFDLLMFMIASILTSFLIHVILSKLSGESVILSLAGLIPGEVMDYLRPSLNVTVTIPLYGPVTLLDYKFQSLETSIRFIAPVGAITLFVLRQLHYRCSNNQRNYPGSNIFIIFLIAAPIVLILDILISLSVIQVLDTSAGDSTIYDARKFRDFIHSYMTDPFFLYYDRGNMAR